MALGTSWTQIASKGFTYLGYSGTAYVYAKLNRQDIAGNKSYVDLQLRINHSVWVQSYNTDFYLTGYGWLGYDYRSYDAGTTTIMSSQITVNHNADGTGSFTATGGYEYKGIGVDATQFTSSSQSLPTIPRASVPSINTYPTNTPKFTLGDTITIHMNRKSSSFKHTVLFKYGSTSVQVGGTRAVENNIQFDTSTVRDAILALIPNASSYAGTIQVTTFNGTTQIGSAQSIPYTAMVPSSYAPDVTGYTSVETATALNGKGIAGDEVVRFLSKKQISVTVTPKAGASINKVEVVNGNKSIQLTLSNGVYTGIMESPPSATFVVKATDSRGLQATITSAGAFREYEYPTIQNKNLFRDSATANTGVLSGDGTFWNGTAGSTTNVVTIQYKLNTASSYSTSAGTRSGNTWNINQAMTGLIYTDSFSCEILVTDSFGQTTTVTVNLPPSNPVMQIGDDTVQVNDYLLAKEDVGIGTGGAGNITVKLSEVASNLSSAESTITSLTTLTTMRNYTWSGSFGEGGSVTKNFRVDGKGFVAFNIYATSAANQDDTGQITTWIDWTNSSNSTVRGLAWDGNRIGVSASFRNSSNSASQLYFDGGTTNNRLKFYASNTKAGTTTWRINMTAIGCTVTAL
ncbi:MAG: hypothetical protein E7185_09775 [Erysipelotrichaceae bacterium]|nr:hypothetical protein [Erysipelotrichaceae bacterium]